MLEIIHDESAHLSKVMSVQLERIPTIPPNEALGHTYHSVYQNGTANLSAEQHSMQNGGTKSYPTRPIVVRRKAKRKEEGLFEIVCGFVVKHQIGTFHCTENPSLDLHRSQG